MPGVYAIVKTRKNIKENILTPGFTFFTIIFFILMLTTYNKNLVDYDHFLYRSYNTKAMLNTDSIVKDIGSLYPPGINLLEYFFAKIVGIYVQGIEAFAVQIFGFSLLIPLFEIAKKSKFISLVITIAIICIPAILTNLIFYESAYPDAILGLIAGYSMYILSAEKENKFKTFSVALILAVATITKPAGFYLSGIIIGMYGLTELLNYKCKTKENIIKFLKSKELKTIIILLLVIVLTLVSWKILGKASHKYARGENASRVGESSTAYAGTSLLTTIFGLYTENHDAADSNRSLIPKIYSTYACLSPVRITIYGAICAIMMSMLITYKYVIKPEKKKNKRKFANEVIAWVVGLAVYIVFLQLSYILKFSTEEMLGHNGIDRYLPTFLLGMIYFVVAMAIKNMSEKSDKKINFCILLCIIIAFTPLQSIANVTLTSGIYNIQSIEYCNNGRIPANKINEKIEENAEIISISQNKKTNIYNLMLRYYLYPNHNVNVCNNINKEMLEKIKERIEKENILYIYIVTYDETLNNEINKQFNTNIKLENDTLYKLQHYEDSIELEKCITTK